MGKKKNVWETNFAENSKIRDSVKEFFVPKMRLARDQRTELEERWMEFFYMWNVTHDGNHPYKGRARLYVPEVRKNVESMTRTLVKAAFPNDDFIDCTPGLSGTNRGAMMQKSVRLWQANQAGLRQKYEIFTRQEVLYGNSPVRTIWSKKTNHIFRSAKGKNGKIVPSRELIEQYNGPTFETRDLFRWYAMNPKKRDFQEDGCFEVGICSESDLRAKVARGELYGLEDILKGNSNEYNQTEMERDVERAEALGLQIQNVGYAGEARLGSQDDEADGRYLMAKIYAPGILPEACLEDEDPELPIPLEIEIYNNEHVGLVRRNPFFFQKAPYVLGRYINPTNEDEAYGQGLPWAIRFMQYEVNSKSEQGMDSATLALNPLAFVDPGLAAQMNDFAVEPGAIWFVSPQGVKLGAIPDTTPTAYNAISQLRAQMADYSDRSPALPSQLQGKSRTATQSEIVSAAVQVDHEAFARNNEADVLEPAMENWESLTDQNITEDQVIMILGRRANDWKRSLVQKNKMLGRYLYFWRGASYQMSKQILGRQMLDAIKVAGTLPAGAVKMNYGEVYKYLWNEVWGLPNADRMIGNAEELEVQDPEVVHKMLDLGMDVEVLPGDDDEVMIKFLNEKLKTEKNPEMKMEMQRLIFKYERQLQLKQSLARQQQLMQQAQLLMMQNQNQKPPQGPRKSPGSGNRTQLSPNASAGDMASGVRG